MKKFLCVLLSTLLMLTPISVAAQYDNNAANQNVSISSIYADEYSGESIVTLHPSELNEISTNIDSFKSFINNGGIIVIDNEKENAVSLCQDLNMQFEPEFFDSEAESNLDADNGKDIVTMYYNYGNGLSGIYVINAQNDITNSEKEILITEAINEIHIIQNAYSSLSVQPLAASNHKKVLGSFTVTATRLPKGKLKATYTFFTVQDYSGKDFYTAKANVAGYPGATLSSTESNYKSKYKGKSLKTIIKTPTNSVTVDSYGPHRAIDESSYSVSVGGSFNADSRTSFGANFSYTKKIADTNIEATSTTKQAQWDVSLRKKAPEKSITFVPAITFVCPKDKDKIIISCSSNYVLDSWDTKKETISVSRSVTCKPASCS